VTGGKILQIRDYYFKNTGETTRGATEESPGVMIRGNVIKVQIEGDINDDEGELTNMHHLDPWRRKNEPNRDSA
jgi:hypothetical protein